MSIEVSPGAAKVLLALALLTFVVVVALDRWAPGWVAPAVLQPPWIFVVIETSVLFGGLYHAHRTQRLWVRRRFWRVMAIAAAAHSVIVVFIVREVGLDAFRMMELLAVELYVLFAALAKFAVGQPHPHHQKPPAAGSPGAE
jgi:hypothetical protein